MSNGISIRSCEIVTRLTDEDGNTIIDRESIESVLKNKNNCVKNYAYIIHDKDTYTAEEEASNPEHIAGTLKPAHVHLDLRFHRNQPQHINDVAGWFNIAENFVSKIKGRWEDAVLYLTHQNTPEKHQYGVDEVTANFDVQAVVDRQIAQLNLDATLVKILTGEIREYNKTKKIDRLMLVYHAREIKEAFKLRAEHLQATQQSRNTEVIFITGPSGTGKTTLAKKIATERKLDYYVSAGSNDVMDGYAQQPCLILDDIRPSCLGLSDLLKLLDNHTASLVKSRYKNKYLNCDLIILTSVLDINQFYSNAFERENEPVTQLKRRCGTYIQMFRSSIIISRWDSATMQYSAPEVFKNDILSQFVPEKPKDPATVRAEIQQLMPFLTPDPMTDVKNMLIAAQAARDQADSPDADEVFASLMPPKERGGGN